MITFSIGTRGMKFGRKGKFASKERGTILKRQRWNGVLVTPSASVKNLGVILDSHLTMELSGSGIDSCTKAFYQLQRIAKIKRFLSRAAVARLVHALVPTLFGVPAFPLKRLQRVQNAAARLTTNTRRSELVKCHFRVLCLPAFLLTLASNSRLLYFASVA